MTIIPYDEPLFKNIKYGGVYFIYAKEKLLYIGQSNNIGSRLIAYMRKQTHLSFDNATHVKIIKSNEMNERKQLESTLIKKYLPPLNYAGTGGKSERCRAVIKKKPVAISLDKDVYEKIKELAKSEDRSFSQQVNKILKDLAVK